MKQIKMIDHAGSFAEDKDVARDLRLHQVIPALDRKEEVTLDFDGVDAATQSFVHALISDLMRRYGNEVLDRVFFKNCNDTVRKIISIVVDYMQEAE